MTNKLFYLGHTTTPIRQSSGILSEEYNGTSNGLRRDLQDAELNRLRDEAQSCSKLREHLGLNQEADFQQMLDRIQESESRIQEGTARTLHEEQVNHSSPLQALASETSILLTRTKLYNELLAAETLEAGYSIFRGELTSLYDSVLKLKIDIAMQAESETKLKSENYRSSEVHASAELEDLKSELNEAHFRIEQLEGESTFTLLSETI